VSADHIERRCDVDDDEEDEQTEGDGDEEPVTIWTRPGCPDEERIQPG